MTQTAHENGLVKMACIPVDFRTEIFGGECATFKKYSSGNIRMDIPRGNYVNIHNVDIEISGWEIKGVRTTQSGKVSVTLSEVDK